MDGLLKLNNKSSFRVVNRSQTKAEIIIYDEIGPYEFFDQVSAKMVDKELKALPDTVNDIEVRLNSPGGDVFEGFTIYNRLKQHKAKVTIYVDGLAASIASIIAMAGDDIIMGEGALMMIHKPWTWTAGNSSELEETIDRLMDIEEQLVKVYQKKTGLDRSEIKSMLAKETWMDGDQALSQGFVTELFQSEETIAASAIDKSVWIKHKPKVKDNNLANKEKLNDFKKNIQEYLART
jgi:ATP-dependent Clp endopeptidase proteolytic subunit ClpP